MSHPSDEGISLEDCFADFLLSREAMMCSAATMKFYRWTGRKVVEGMQSAGASRTVDVTARMVRAYLSELAGQGCKPSYVHSHARVIRALLRFAHQEGYLAEPVKFQMPQIPSHRLPVLTEADLKKVLDSDLSARDRALFLTLVDTGLRRSELVGLNWGDVDLDTGLITLRRGKGGKSRIVVVGATTRRALLHYRRSVAWSETSPLFQTVQGTRLKPNGLRTALLRITEKSGVSMSPHALRRTFATLSLRAGMSPLHLQGLLGHTTLEMTRRYAQMVDEDLVNAHRRHGPIDWIC